MQVEDRQPSVVIDAKTYDRLALALLLVFGVVAAGRNFWIADDAFMYLRTALQYVQGNGLRFNAVERVQAFTSPGWMLVLANLYYPIRNVAALVFVASLLFWVASTMMIYFSLQRERWRILFIFVALYSTRLFTDYQTSGLETPLLFFTLVGFYFAVSGQKQWKEQILWISLVGVTRFDALLFCVPCIVLLAWKEKLFLPQKALQACLAGAPLALWCLFAIFYYGSILPSPAIAKLNHLIPTSVLLTQGVIYLVDLFQRDTAAAILIFTGIVAPWCAADSINRGIAAGVLLHLVYVVTIGGDFMQGRFFMESFVFPV